MPDNSSLKVAVVGYGSIGRRHVANLLELGVVNPLVVRRADGANQAFSPPNGAQVTTSLAEVLDSKPDLGIVCNPTSLHVATASRFLSAGIPVLIEKPLGGDLPVARELAAIAEQRKTRGWMAYCLRWHPAYALARRMLAEGAIGRLLYAKAWFETYLPDWHPWEDYRQSYAARRDLGGGLPLTLDHELDFVPWCCGATIRAEGWTSHSGTLEMDVPDVASIALELTGGATAHVQLSLCRRRPSRGFMLVGERGELCYDFQAGRLELATTTNSVRTFDFSEPAFLINNMYRDMLADLLAVLRGESKELPTIAAGLATMEIAAQCRRLAVRA